MELQTKYPPAASLLPHKRTMLLVDEIEDYSLERLVVSTAVKENSPFFDGHFPGHPILPGVILVEMMNQACCLFGSMSAIYANSENGEPAVSAAEFESFARNLKVRSIGIDKVVFKKPVYPKAQLIIEVKPLKKFRNFSTYVGKIFDKSNNELVVKGNLTVFVDKNS